MAIVNSRGGNSRNVEIRCMTRVRRMYRVRSTCRRRQRLRTVAAFGAMLALTACGFRLGGSDSLPGVLAPPYLALKDPYTDFSRELQHQLKDSGATLQLVLAKSTATIEVTKDV